MLGLFSGAGASKRGSIACTAPNRHSPPTLSLFRPSFYTRIGSNKGKTPEHNEAKPTKHPHSLEWHNSTITIVFPSTLRNTLVVMTKHTATTPTKAQLRNCFATRNQTPRSTKQCRCSDNYIGGFLHKNDLGLGTALLNTSCVSLTAHRCAGTWRENSQPG